MIRPFTCICMLAAAGSGLYLYQTKHRAQLLDREIMATYKQIDQAKDRIGVLKGEWALLSEPERLANLAQKHLMLKTLAPSQFVALADLGARLPAALPHGPLTIPDYPAVPMAQPLAPAVAPNVPVAAARPIVAAKPVATAERSVEKPADKPVAVAALPQPASPPVAHAATRTAGLAATPPATPLAAGPAISPPVPPLPAPVSVAAVLPPSRPASSALQTGAIAPVPTPPHTQAPHILAPVMNVSAGGIAGPAATARSQPGSIGESVARTTRAQQASAVSSGGSAAPSGYAAAAPMIQPAYSPAYASGPAYGSALGGAGRVALPAPVPYGAVQAAR